MVAPIDKLSEGQRDCLRLVQAGYEAKEIARALQLNPHTVIERLRAARRVLGVGSSREAARLLAAVEAGTDYNRHVTNPIGIVQDHDPEAFSAASIGRGSAMEFETGVALREEQAPYRWDQARPDRFPWPVPTSGRTRNSLTGLQTIVAIVGLTVGLAIAALVAVAMVEQLSRLSGG